MKTTASMDLKEQLALDRQAFVDVVNPLTNKQFREHAGEQWSVADVMQHLYLSARPVARLMTGPRAVLTQWGKPDQPVRTYEEIASDYANVLTTGAKAPPMSTPRPEDMDVEDKVIIDRFTAIYQTLIDAIDHWSAQELDDYCIPHPVLGKLTVREMLFFTSVHTQHHLRLLPIGEK